MKNKPDRTFWASNASRLVIVRWLTVLVLLFAGCGLTGESGGRAKDTKNPAEMTRETRPGPGAVTLQVFLNVESVAKNVWSCIGGPGSNLRCGGPIDPDNLSSDRWTCGESMAEVWNCSGNVDGENLRLELWGCKDLTVGSWFCSVDIDGTDATMEL